MEDLELYARLLATLSGQLTAAGVPHHGVSRAGVDYAAEATSEQRAAGDQIHASFLWNAEEQIERTRLAAERADLSEFRERYVARLAQIDSDLADLAAATNNQVKQIIGRMLQAERGELKALRALLKG